MIQLENIEDQEFILEVSNDWSSFDGDLQLPLLVGKRDYTKALKKGKYGQGTDPALYLDGYVTGTIPLGLTNAPVVLDCLIGGVRVPGLRSFRSIPRQDSGGSGGTSGGSSSNSEGKRTTQLISASAGSFLPRAHLADIPPDATGRRVKTYSGARPEEIVRDALYRLPYTRSQIHIEAVNTPLIYMTETSTGGGFGPEHTAADLISVVTAHVDYVIRDTARGGVVASLAPRFTRLGGVVATFDARSLVGWVSPVPADGQYSHVEVFRLAPDGRDAYRVKAAVDYSRLDYAPFAETPLMIQFTDDSSEGADRAQQLAYDKAFQLGRGTFTGEATLPFFPLLERDDAIRIDEQDEDDDGPFKRSWLCYIDTFYHEFATNVGIYTVITYTAQMLSEERPDTLAPAGSLRQSAGVVPTPI